MNIQEISLESKVCQSEGNIVSDMDGEKVMMSINNGKYYNLGEIGGEIWDLIKTPISVNEIILTLMSIYDVEKTECEEHVISFLKHLSKEKIIHFEV
ncbi:lasso peptide biosynthesis PqqD family chaperone [Metabacillus litoralis]|jgi:hypothetical protein|uniref:lasso peptide biosynthesis PqqD family chaperone n=1 Tax=Metabacillus litoralis TaxID=152268 RepID=UPI00203B69AE|nr:lasso peptide biosynthesis PqqD family chaperone [Metabacillus litoralis]MCM3650407.1 lasso peptide biosynthesis PqqD family chaperone [Metabacillus litoralis]